jgi:A/G-specific adenine glycosylase
MHADRADACAHYAAGVPMTPEQLAERVLTWYAVHGRDLPWRHTRDPYAILVSEVMLQQTQVERVIERWTAWLERWPTAAALAAAPRAEVIAAWQGLGYNRRAVALHEAAGLLAEHGIPQDQAGWRALPGVGPYTAAAVCALALDHDVVPLDVNVQRILERALDAQTIEPPTGRGHDLTQALFDLGATTCLARIPRCEQCPLADACPSRGQRYAPQRKQSRFEGSRRQARGQLLDRLRAGPVRLADCDPAIAALLIDDGLAERQGRRLTLPR